MIFVQQLKSYLFNSLIWGFSELLSCRVLEDNALPMPAYVFYAKNGYGYKCGGRLSSLHDMLRKGLVRVITSCDDWRRNKKSKNFYSRQKQLYSKFLTFQEPELRTSHPGQLTLNWKRLSASGGRVDTSDSGHLRWRMGQPPASPKILLSGSLVPGYGVSYHHPTPNF